MPRCARRQAAAAVGAALLTLLGSAASSADPLPNPSDFRLSGGSFSLGASCQIGASIFIDNARVPDGDPSSRVTAYYQMETRPDDGRGSYYWDDWADWDQYAARRQGGWNEFDLYRQDVSPLAFERGYLGDARRWEGVMPFTSEVPPTNLGYSVWNYGFKTFRGGRQRQDWRVVRERNGAPPGSTDNLVSIVRKTDVPAQPLGARVRGGTGPGAPDSGIVRVVGVDGAPRAWTNRSALTFAMTGLDTTCDSSVKSDPLQRDAARNPNCQPDPQVMAQCWNNAVAANSSPSGRLDYHSDGTYGPSPYCSHLAGQMIAYRWRDRSDCPPKRSLQQYRDAGLLPAWWCSSKTWFGFCAESQVDWIGNRQKRVWMQATDLANGAESHAAMASWYGEPQGNVSRNACPRNADGSAQFGNPRTCFYEGWWQGELSIPVAADGRHPIAVHAIDDTFRSWLKGAPSGVQNRSGSTVVVNRDTVGPFVRGAMDAVGDGSTVNFSAAGVVDEGGAEAAIGVNPNDVWLYACRRGSAGCELASIPEDGAGADRMSMRMSPASSDRYTATATNVPEGDWLWKVVPYDLLGNRGESSAFQFRGVRAEPAADVSTVETGGSITVDVISNDRWLPADAMLTLTVLEAPRLGTASVASDGSGRPVIQYASRSGTPDGSTDGFIYRLCAAAGRSRACGDASVTINVRGRPERRPT